MLFNENAIHLRAMKHQTRCHVLIICILLLISFVTLFSFDTQSLVAHDEGLYARRAKFLLESGDWLSPFFTPHHKTVGSYWPIASSFKLFGVSDWAARLPSILSAIIATNLFYFISRRYFNSSSSFVASLALLATPLYFQYSRTSGPDMLFVLIVIAQVHFLVSINGSSYLSNRLKMIGFGVCISLAFFVRSFVALIPVVSLVPLILSRNFSKSLSFWAWIFLGVLLGSFPLLLNLYCVFIDHGSAGLLSLFSFASKKVGATGFGAFLSIPFYFSRALLLTFPIFLVILPNARSFKGGLSPSVFASLKSEINSLAVLFPLIYLSVLSFMGTRHYHYLIPLVPFLALNIARIDLSSKGRRFTFEAYFIGFLGFLYLLGAFLIYLLRPGGVTEAAVYFAVVVLLVCSILCFCAFGLKILLLKKVTPFALLLVIFVSQFLSLSALAGGGLIWSTNKELKSLARTINAECHSSGVYLYGLSSKDLTVLRFYLDKPYVLDGSEDLPSLSKKCLVIPSEAEEVSSQEFPNHLFLKTYFR